MKALAFRLIGIAAVVVALTFPALAERRVALVIGNSAYESTARLSNPVNDARKLAETLKSIGFDTVELKLDLGYSQLRRALGSFTRTAAGADIAVIYFAGHGIEVGGANYLIPTDARLGHVDDVEFEAVDLNKAVYALNRARKLKLVIVDACRNNPFAARMKRAGASRAVGRGLARVNPGGSETLIAYAAKEGTVALDGDGANSPFATSLIKHIATPGLDVRLMFGRVHDDVLEATGGKQEPFTYGALGGQAIALAPAAKTQPTVSAVGTQPALTSALGDKESLFWLSIKDSRNPADFREYLRRFAGGTFAGLAKLRLAALSKTAAVTPRVPVTEKSAGTGSVDTFAKLVDPPTGGAGDKLWTLVSVPTYAEAGSPKEIGNWSIGVFPENGGAFSHCAASVGYKSGTTLLFSVITSGRWSMGLTNAKWSMRKGAKFPLSYQIDNGPMTKATALVKNTRLVQIFLPTSLTMFDRFRTGDVLKVMSAGKVMKFNLTDAAKVLNVLVGCAEQYTRTGVVERGGNSTAKSSGDVSGGSNLFNLPIDNGDSGGLFNQ